ncbi:flavin reductase family protein [Streptomyces sp. NBC_00059]|uniref:flavin reductase family protein n=1 Tax=Streptomyces sp. NBC_00059 TaxID=2975635 RepID=UPI00224E0D34|nr:flavin reductase family protein [Streptomyces sp. NBC_00059]MCX5417776.1 flavin reductase family protein [Streptomyces sp. NBC_00059]
MHSVSTDAAITRGPAANPAPLREVMSLFATGVTVLSVGGEHGHGMTANAFASVSLDPPSVLCRTAHDAVMYEALLGGAMAWLECEVSAACESGDHTVFIGDVVGASRGEAEDALLFFDGALQRAGFASR